jgi:hypothetical protein
LTTLKVPKPRIPKVSDRYAGDMAAQSRRVTGVTPRTVGAYQSKPYRYLRKATAFSTPGGQGSLQKLVKGTL